MLEITLESQTLVLLPQRAVWWPAQKALIVSDLHVGKAAHFRKAGLAVPRAASDADMACLDALVQSWQPRQLIATGDLFHSIHNREVEAFGNWRQQYPALGFRLVRGNHDILNEAQYQHLKLALHDRLAIPPFSFRHHPPAEGETEPLYTLSGHLHPGFALRGPARQYLRLPCFYFRPRYAILPAFSRLTGLALIQPGADDRVFVIADEAVVQVR